MCSAVPCDTIFMCQLQAPDTPDITPQPATAWAHTAAAAVARGRG